MPLVRINHEHKTRYGSDHRRQRREHRSLLRLKQWTIAAHSVLICQHQHRKYNRREGRMHEVAGPELVLGQIFPPNIDVVDDHEWPQSGRRGQAVVMPAICAGVGVGEAGEAARGATEKEESTG